MKYIRGLLFVGFFVVAGFMGFAQTTLAQVSNPDSCYVYAGINRTAPATGVYSFDVSGKTNCGANFSKLKLVVSAEPSNWPIADTVKVGQQCVGDKIFDPGRHLTVGDILPWSVSTGPCFSVAPGTELFKDSVYTCDKYGDPNWSAGGGIVAGGLYREWGSLGNNMNFSGVLRSYSCYQEGPDAPADSPPDPRYGVTDFRPRTLTQVKFNDSDAASETSLSVADLSQPNSGWFQTVMNIWPVVPFTAHYRIEVTQIFEGTYTCPAGTPLQGKQHDFTVNGPNIWWCDAYSLPSEWGTLIGSCASKPNDTLIINQTFDCGGVIKKPTITVSTDPIPTDYICIAPATNNYSYCQGDTAGITGANKASVGVVSQAACSAPVGSEPKCQYYCNPGFYMTAAGQCLPYQTPSLTAVPGICGTKNIVLTWTAPTAPAGGTLSGYRLYRNGTQIPSSSTIASSVLTHTDSAPANGTSYVYEIEALFTVGGVTVPSPRKIALQTTPVGPTQCLTCSGTVSGNTVTWTAAPQNNFNPDPMTYTWTGTDSLNVTAAATAIKTYTTSNTKSATVSATQAGVTRSGSCTVPITITTRPPVSGITAVPSACGTSKILVTWGAPVGGTPTSYRIYQGGSAIPLGEVSAPTLGYVATLPAFNTIYTLQVEAVYPSGVSTKVMTLAITPKEKCVSCFGVLQTGNRIQWTAVIESGFTPSTYAWSGAVSGNTQTVMSSAYTTSGTKTANVDVTPVTGMLESASCALPFTVGAALQCGGVRPAGTTICSGDDTSLTGATSWTMVAGNPSCTVTKCEYYYTCSGTVPAGYVQCTSSNTNIDLVSPAAWHLVGSCNLVNKCEYLCPSGMTYNPTTNSCLGDLSVSLQGRVNGTPTAYTAGQLNVEKNRKIDLKSMVTPDDSMCQRTGGTPGWATTQQPYFNLPDDFTSDPLSSDTTFTLACGNSISGTLETKSLLAKVFGGTCDAYYDLAGTNPIPVGANVPVGKAIYWRANPADPNETTYLWSSPDGLVTGYDQYVRVVYKTVGKKTAKVVISRANSSVTCADKEITVTANPIFKEF